MVANMNYTVFIPVSKEDDSADKGLRLDQVWCGGRKSRGCGSKYSLLTAKRDGDFFICPVCGRVN